MKKELKLDLSKLIQKTEEQKMMHKSKFEQDQQVKGMVGNQFLSF